MPKTVEIQVGKKIYEVEEMDLEQLEAFLTLQKPLLESADIPTQIGILAKCLQAALMRVAPDIKEEEIKRSLTWNGMMSAMQAARDVSGLVSVQAGETLEAVTGTGTASIQTLQTEPDGPSTISEG